MAAGVGAQNFHHKVTSLLSEKMEELLTGEILAAVTGRLQLRFFLAAISELILLLVQHIMSVGAHMLERHT